MLVTSRKDVTEGNRRLTDRDRASRVGASRVGMVVVRDGVFGCYGKMRVKPPFLEPRMPGHFKRYSGCRDLVRRMPL